MRRLTFSPKTTDRIIRFYTVTTDLRFKIPMAALEVISAATLEILGYRYLAIASGLLGAIDILTIGWKFGRRDDRGPT